MKYRREIDGLRAVAVLPVIFFHAGFGLFSGGFIGVDVFFVISGYLITTIILADMNDGKFSLATFYERRARRILPALFFVILCCIPFAWLWLLPNDLKSFCMSLVGVSTFSSNIIFWRESGYFETAAELKPLLHTWSLAVEEQYYILFPLFLMALWKLRKRWIFGALIVVAAVSLAAAQWGAQNKPAATFFLLPTRMWELAIGALIAFYFLYKRDQAEFITSHKITSEALGSLGLALICYSIFAFNKSTPFPSFYALVPTVGTALIIIFATSKTVVGRLLGTKAMVGIGLISYSTYLWHQPLFVFARHRSITTPTSTFLLILSFLSIVLAYFSWRFVEIPFRDRKVFGRKKIFVFAVVGSIFFAAIGLAGQIGNGFKSRFTVEQLNTIKFIESDVNKFLGYGTCFLGDNYIFTDFSKSCYEKINDKSVVIWGDSYAAALSYGLRENLNDVYQLTASKCPPVFNIETPNLGCYDINNFIKSIIEEKKPDYILMHASWEIYFKEVSFSKIISTISEIKRISPKSKIIIVGGIPRWPGDLPVYLFKNNINSDRILYLKPREDSYAANVTSDNIFKQITKFRDITFVSLVDILCDNGECAAVILTNKGYALTSFDYGHLTAEASVMVTGEILNRIMLKDETLDKNPLP